MRIYHQFEVILQRIERGQALTSAPTENKLKKENLDDWSMSFHKTNILSL